MKKLHIYEYSFLALGKGELRYLVDYARKLETANLQLKRQLTLARKKQYN